jgi:HAD superfamily hydrolase (TIGR01509 family)
LCAKAVAGFMLTATNADNFIMIFEAVLFDCDGVLVDSEAITCGVLRDMLDENGWRMSLAECMAHFVGHSVRSRAELIESHTGKPLTDDFMDEFYRRRNIRLEKEITAIDGIHDAVRHVYERCEGRIAVASGADRFKVEMMLQRVGLFRFFEGRIFSGHEMPRSKPFPDVYLAAAANLQVAPAKCLVVEDTTVGIVAGVASGSRVWAYSPSHSQNDALLQAGAVQVFAHMNDLRI